MHSKVHCNNCRSVRNHDIIYSHGDIISDNSNQTWQIIRCRGCDNISFLLTTTKEDGEGIITEEEVYPPKQIRQQKLFVEAPDKIDQLYRETIDAYNGNMNLFCAGGLRALVEAICLDQNITDGPKKDRITGELLVKSGQVLRGKTLDCKIEGLLEKQIITPIQTKTLHQHRFLGNEALHELKTPKHEDLHIAIDLFEHIMEEIYSINAKTINLEGARTQK